VKFVKRSAVALTSVLLVGAIAGSIFMFNSIKAVEPMVDHIEEHLKDYNSKPSIIYSANHIKLYEINPISSEPVNVSALPKHVIHAVLAAEDKRFYEHPGVDYMGLGRVLKKFVSRSDNVPGGSTITMQLAKKLFSASERKIQRKVQDISIAIQLEKRYTKDQILELYLNQIYYGEQAYGLNAAAEIYFGKKAEDLDIAEAAMIARCIRTPSKENPVKNYQLANENKIVVLDTMKQEGWVTEKEYEKAKAEKPKVIGLNQKKFSKIYHAPYFVAAVKRDLEKMGINISEGGYSITTTLDSELQEQAEDSVRKHVRSSQANVGAFLCMDSQGRVLADVGGVNYSKNQYSYTTQSLLQPGSAFKSMLYAEALKDGFIGDENSEISNEPVKIKLDRKTTFAPKSHGPQGTVSLYDAFIHSYNAAAVNTYVKMGYKSTNDHVKEDFGITTPIAAYPASALGTANMYPVQLLEAYSVFMLDGQRVKPYRIREISGPNGDLLFQGKMDFVSTRIGPDTCQVMEKIMRGVVTSGTGTEASDCPDAHGKTGTTNGGKSVWFCGYAKGVVGISWAGSEYYSKKRNKWLQREMPEEYGGSICAPMWAEIMNAAVKKYGSDVKPDFSKQPGEEGHRHQPKVVEPDSNNDEPPIDDANSVTIDSNAPALTPDTNDQNPTKTGDGTVDPLKDSASGVTKPVPDIPIAEPKKTKDDKPIKVPKVGDTEMIEVEVCADSGLLATKYCPETINKSMPRNKRPKRHCNLHKAPDEGGGG
jgi:penicillin-binding protein 1A